MDCAAYGLDYQARSLCALPHAQGGAQASPTGVETHRFLVGTAVAKGGNRVYLLEFRDDTRLVDCAAEWTHETEIVSLAASLHLPFFSTVHPVRAMSAEMAVSVFPENASPIGDLTPAFTTRVDGAQAVVWHPMPGDRAAAIRCSKGVSLCKLQSPGDATNVTSIAAPAATTLSALCWDPHHADVMIAGAQQGGTVRLDARQKAASPLTARAHLGAVRDVDHNPNRMYFFVTAGDDGCVRLWDTRRSDEPVETRPPAHTLHAHDHACRVARYNPSHDSLLLTGAADHHAKLWYLPSLSHNAGVAPKSAPSGKKLKEGVARSLADLGDTVYASAWSAASPWVFATCTHAGKVLVDEVPADYKMGILLAGSE